MSLHTRVLLTTLLVCGFISDTIQAQTQRAPALWEQVQTAEAVPRSKEAVAAQAIRINLARLQSDDNQAFTLIVPNARPLRISKVREERRRPGGYIWTGTIVGDALSSVTFSVVNRAVVGTVLHSNGTLYRVSFWRGDFHILEQIDQRKFPPEDDPTPIGARQQTIDHDTCATDSGAEIDVLVVYTDDARAAAGSKDAMEATVNLAVAETNQSYLNSGVGQRLRLVHVAEVDYAESGVSQTDRDALQNKSDNILDNVHTLRDTFAADTVVLITETLASCGRAFIMETVSNAFEDHAFGVVKRSCATGNFSFGHELGHIMSARHDWFVDSTNNSPFTYNHGHTHPNPATAGVNPWRTVMAYNDACVNAGTSCTRIQHWSNPSINWNGEATGTAGGTQPEDNHRALDNTALTVANFRCSSPGRNDVWMKDTWSDSGAEPDPNQATEGMWYSPYIWVRHTSDSQQIHQHQHENPELNQPQFINVKLHNGGAAANGALEVYGAPASTGLSWPIHWTLLGSQAASIPAHASTIVELPWTPTTAGHYCLIARWVSASDPMTTAETSDIDANVRGNNNIIWRNVNTIDLGGDSSESASFIVRNISEREARFSLLIHPPKPRPVAKEGGTTFLSFGRVTLHLSPELHKLWAATGYKGDGLRRARGKIVVTGRTGARIDGLVLPPAFEAPATITFDRPRAGAYPRDMFEIEVIQAPTGSTKPAGGITYQVNTRRN